MKRRYPYGTKRKYKYRPTIKRRRRYQGLVPQYVGFSPRQFALGEWKYNDISPAPVAVDSALPVSVLLNGLVSGTTATTRIGTNITIRSIEARLHDYVNIATGDSQLHRIIFVIDRQTNGLGAAVADVITGGVYNGVRNLSNRKRFKIIIDKTIVLSQFGQSGEDSFRHIYYKFKRPLKTEYNTGVAGTVADISTNGVYMFVMGNKTGGGGGFIKYDLRLRYTDM